MRRRPSASRRPRPRPSGRGAGCGAASPIRTENDASCMRTAHVAVAPPPAVEHMSNDTERRSRAVMDETRATAQLPSLDVEILHRRLPEEQAEQLAISLKATPSFGEFA